MTLDTIKKHLYALLLVMMTTLLMSQPLSVLASDTLDITGESAILVDGETGKVLYAKNPDVALPPASMTKMMTEYLVWEAIDQGEISWETTTQISDYAYGISANTSFSGIGLIQNKDYTVKGLYEAMGINSDNATTIALAELIAGSEGEFVRLMNETGAAMGLSDFRFVNSTGLENASLGDNYPEGTEPDGINLLTARSAALLAYHLINDYPESLDISSIPQIEFDGQLITNWNWMLPHPGNNLKQYFYEGVDGLKTGNTNLAGFCFTGTAERSGQRLIMVIMKTDSADTRFKETAKMFDYGYENFKTETLFPDGYQLEEQPTLDVAKGKVKTVRIALKDGFQLPIKAEEADKYRLVYHVDAEKLTSDGKLTAPITKGDKIGTVELVYTGEGDHGYIDGRENNFHDLIATEDVEENNWFMIMIGAVADFFIDLFMTIVNTVKGWF